MMCACLRGREGGCCGKPWSLAAAALGPDPPRVVPLESLLLLLLLLLLLQASFVFTSVPASGARVNWHYCCSTRAESTKSLLSQDTHSTYLVRNE